MPQRKYTQKRCNVTKVSKRITLPISWAEYQQLSQDATAFRGWLDQMMTTYPELFPNTIAAGYSLHDILPASAKLTGIRLNKPGPEQVKQW